MGQFPAAEVVAEFIYVGGKQSAQNLEELEQRKITHILNVADDVENFFPDKFHYTNLHVADFGQDEGISRIFPDAIAFVKKVKEENGRVLIHCFAGQNRSVTVTTAVLMELYGWPLDKAFLHVRSKREGAFPFPDNQEELMRWELQKFGTNSLSTKEDWKQFHTENFRLVS